MAAAVCGWVAVAASAQTPPTRYIVEVPADSPADLHALEEAGYQLSHVHPGHAELLVTPEQLKPLQDAYPVTIIDVQPNPPAFSGEKALGTYPSLGTLVGDLQQVAADHPDIVRLTSLGQSVQGRHLWAMLITDNPDIEEDEPEFKYVSTMHGDEPVGTAMCMYLIDRLTSDYGSDSRITELVDETAIWIVPLMNPDGWVNGTRTNANGFDLNRHFPYYPSQFTDTIFDGAPLLDESRQPEIAHIMRWSAENSFVLSANLHTGTVVVNYPYDFEPGYSSGEDALSPDDALFEALSLIYATHNTPMYNSFIFDDDITNGSAWYSIDGGMQDWNYRYLANMEVTIELAVPKKPNQSQLPTYWANNEESMLSYMEAVHTGIRGVVREHRTGPPIYAAITIDNNPQRVFTDPDVGDYHRILLPGTYTVTVEAPGYPTRVYEDVEVVAGAATRLDVTYEPAASLPLNETTIALVAAFIAVWASLRRRRKCCS